MDCLLSTSASVSATGFKLILGTFPFLSFTRERLGNEFGASSLSPFSLRLISYNLGQIKWKIETTPPPKINGGKMARFGLHAASSLIWGGGGGEGGISVPFYSVQDCSVLD